MWNILSLSLSQVGMACKQGFIPWALPSQLMWLVPNDPLLKARGRASELVKNLLPWGLWDLSAAKKTSGSANYQEKSSDFGS